MKLFDNCQQEALLSVDQIFSQKWVESKLADLDSMSGHEDKSSQTDSDFMENDLKTEKAKKLYNEAQKMRCQIKSMADNAFKEMFEQDIKGCSLNDNSKDLDTDSYTNSNRVGTSSHSGPQINFDNSSSESPDINGFMSNEKPE